MPCFIIIIIICNICVFQLSGIPNIIGCIDGSCIKIRKPARKIWSTNTNRHDQTSLTMQAVCDSENRFLDVFTEVPGKVHDDSSIFTLSSLFTRLENICAGKYHILGDGAYEIREWLLTPYRNCGNSPLAKKSYIDHFYTARVVTENSFSMLKNRFRQLMCVEMLEVDRMSKFIISCCVLHNICIECDDEQCNDIAAQNVQNNSDEADQLDIHPGAQNLRQRCEIKRNEI